MKTKNIHNITTAALLASCTLLLSCGKAKFDLPNPQPIFVDTAQKSDPKSFETDHTHLIDTVTMQDGIGDWIYHAKSDETQKKIDSITATSEYIANEIITRDFENKNFRGKIDFDSKQIKLRLDSVAEQTRKKLKNIASFERQQILIKSQFDKFISSIDDQGPLYQDDTTMSFSHMLYSNKRTSRSFSEYSIATLYSVLLRKIYPTSNLSRLGYVFVLRPGHYQVGFIRHECKSNKNHVSIIDLGTVTELSQKESMRIVDMDRASILDLFKNDILEPEKSAQIIIQSTKAYYQLDIKGPNQSDLSNPSTVPSIFAWGTKD